MVTHAGLMNSSNGAAGEDPVAQIFARPAVERALQRDPERRPRAAAAALVPFALRADPVITPRLDATIERNTLALRRDLVLAAIFASGLGATIAGLLML